MKALALLLAIAFLIIGVLYGMGTINFFTKSGAEHAHHMSHLIISWVLALLCLIWYRFQSSPQSSR